ncbi:ring-cleaving dioxygenase [Paenibacillus sp. R14(2021)]|uniref:ring-cleaving dioxygenase n=1 Tax=Paenibacillus sp. R14(2021) TaxID=2859228 RepID=UPI001C61526E|nr:ring-cleaving dioxygenase [Paenibacillus sp. R14(2021)]
MSDRTTGIHHITAFARDPQENASFYTGILGLHLVKKTVNFDAPDTYHLYFGDASGSPGTVITFFPSSKARKGRIGGGQVGVTTFVVPVGTIAYWEQRFTELGIAFRHETRFSESYLQFTDPDGLRLELTERSEGPVRTDTYAGIPADKAIKGFGGAVLFSRDYLQTMDVLERVLGLAKVGEEDGFARFQSSAELGNRIDVPLSNMEWGSGGVGTVHHIAWRAKDNEEHARWREIVAASGYKPTEIKDRQYFKAVYFREHGGILFEIATDAPGFARDERQNELGRKLMLPEWFEPRRAEIEAVLQPITIEEPSN